MKRIALILTVLAAPVVASAQGTLISETDPSTINASGIARAASLYIGIYKECPKYYSIDAGFLNKAVSLYEQVGEQKFGEPFKKIYSEEIQRRMNEVEATGAYYWCSYQRGYQSTLYQKGGSMFRN